MFQLLSTHIVQELSRLTAFLWTHFRILPWQYFILAHLYKPHISGISICSQTQANEKWLLTWTIHTRYIWPHTFHLHCHKVCTEAPSITHTDVNNQNLLLWGRGGRGMCAFGNEICKFKVTDAVCYSLLMPVLLENLMSIPFVPI